MLIPEIDRESQRGVKLDARGNLLEQLSDQAAQTLAVFRFQVNEFDTGSVGGDIAHYRRALNFPHPGFHFQLHGFADTEALIGFQ